MDRKKTLTLLVVLFAAVYYVFRIAIFYMGITGEMSFEEEQTRMVEDFVTYSFLAIGVAGLLFLPGVLLHRPWGFWGTVVVGAYTIVFDLWAFMDVQASAGAGIVPAGIITAYLVLFRRDYLGKEAKQ